MNMEHAKLVEAVWQVAGACGGAGIGVILFVGLPMLRDWIKRRG